MGIVSRFHEDKNRIIYRREWKEIGVKKYFESIKGQATGKEFRSSLQVKAYLKAVTKAEGK